MKRLRIPLFMLACAVFICFALFYSGGINAEIVDILGQLDCPALIPDVSDTSLLSGGDYSLVESSNLLLTETGEYQGLSIELWKATGGDCLALLRSGDTVYAAQYVNNDDPSKSMIRGRFSDRIYSHEAYSEGNIHYRVAFFTGGNACLMGFAGENTIAETDLRTMTTDGSVAALLAGQ